MSAHPHCQCDAHDGRECGRNYVYALVARNGKLLWVCDRCDLTGDERIAHVGASMSRDDYRDYRNKRAFYDALRRANEEVAS